MAIKEIDIRFSCRKEHNRTLCCNARRGVCLFCTACIFYTVQVWYMPYVRICHMYAYAICMYAYTCAICTYAYGKTTCMVQPCTYGVNYLYRMHMNTKYTCKYLALQFLVFRELFTIFQNEWTRWKYLWLRT